MNKKENNTSTIVIVIIVIIILLLFLASLGTIDPGNIGKIPNEYRDTKEDAKRRHKKIVALIEKQTILKIKLDKKFKKIYFSVRLGLLLLWFAILSIFYFCNQIKNVGDILNFSQASILILLAINFLTFGTITNLKNFIDRIKIETENWVYGKYITIEQRIELNKKELVALEEDIKKRDSSIVVENMQIFEYQFQFDQQNFEIFPPCVWNDQFIVFHGTSAYHSGSIDANGLRVGVAPFNVATARALLTLLTDPRVGIFDVPNNFTGINTAQGLENYLEYINGNQPRISLSNLSASCLTFSTGQLKGGQALRYITEARGIIERAIHKDENIRTLITDQINNLFDVCNRIHQAPGVVYAIKIPSNLENFVLENNVIYTTQTISLDLIVGKVIVMNPPDMNTTACNERMRAKLFKSSEPIGLGILFGRLNNDNDL